MGRTAQRVLNEQFTPSIVPALEKMALDPSGKNNAHMHALWILVSQHALSPEFHLKVLSSADEPTRNWGVRAAGEMREVAPEVFAKLSAMTEDASPDVRCQLAVAAGRLQKPDGLPILFDLMHNPENAKDPLIPTIIYNNIKPLVYQRGAEIVDTLEKDKAAQANFGETVVRWVETGGEYAGANAGANRRQARSRVWPRRQSNRKFKIEPALQDVIDGFDNSGVKSADRGKFFDEATRNKIAGLSASATSPARIPATVIALWWHDEKASEAARAILADRKIAAPIRSMLLKALAEQKNAANVPAFSAFIVDNAAPVRLRQEAVNALGLMGDANAAAVLVEDYDKAQPVDLKPMIIDALVQSKTGAGALLDAVKQKRIPRARSRRIMPAASRDITIRRWPANWRRHGEPFAPNEIRSAWRSRKSTRKSSSPIRPAILLSARKSSPPSACSATRFTAKGAKSAPTSPALGAIIWT